jgi:nucleoside-diphosphate-sugar epimerase
MAGFLTIKPMNPNPKIYVAGLRGVVGSAIVTQLLAQIIRPNR